MNTTNSDGAKNRKFIIGTSLASLALLGGIGLATTANAANSPAPATSSSQSSQANTGTDSNDGQEKELTVTGSVAAPAEEQGTEAPDDQEVKALQALAKISTADAEKAASAAVNGSRVISSHLSEENGYVVYDVLVEANGTQTEVAVDAGNAAVLAQEQSDGAEQNDHAAGSNAEEAAENGAETADDAGGAASQN